MAQKAKEIFWGISAPASEKGQIKKIDSYY